MPREFSRSRRLEEAIQRILGEALAGKVRDPRLSGVVVTQVQVSRDLGVARIYYTLLSGEPVSPDMDGALRAASGFLRSVVARQLRIRRVPELRFLQDRALERGRALESLIDRAVAGPDQMSVEDQPGLPEQSD